MKVAVLAGGVGGARLCAGLHNSRRVERLQVVVNTGDDFRLHGLWISPDLDSVYYTLAGWADPERGWGYQDETWNCAERLKFLGGESWFQLGDKDLATHLYRTQQLSEGWNLTQITGQLCLQAGLPADILLPMTDSVAQTRIRVEEGWLDFQDYFVRRQQKDRVLEVQYPQAEENLPSPAVLRALEQADRLILAPSNPFLSLFPIFELQGFADFWAGLPTPKVAVSPMLGNQAVKGPLASLLESLGYPVNSLGIAQLLKPWADTLIIDSSDAALEKDISRLGLRVVLTSTLMSQPEDRLRLAEAALDA